MCFQETTVLKFAYQEDVVELLGNFCKLLMGGIKCIHQFKRAWDVMLVCGQNANGQNTKGKNTA